RLQKDDRVERRGLPVVLDHAPLEAQVVAQVPRPCMLVCVRVGIDAHDQRGLGSEQIGSVALPACHVDHPPAGHPGRDPLVHSEVAAKPVVLYGHVRQRALAGQLERWHAGRLTLLNIDVHSEGGQSRVPPAMEALRSADEIRDLNTRYHDVAAATYDTKWGIDFGAVGQAQVVGKLRKLLGAELDGGFERSLEIGAGTGYFSLNLLQAGIVHEATCTDISPGMVATLADNAKRLGLEVRAARADAESLPFAGE